MNPAHHLSRRQLLANAANGFGGLAFSALLGSKAARAVPRDNPLTPQAPHFAARAKSVIFLFMDGGPSQMDTFDPKPRLNREDGQPIPFEVKGQFANTGKVLGSPFAFAQHGECGAWVSEILPHLARHVDQMAFVRSLNHTQIAHPNACYMVNTGHSMAGKPSLGSWVTYGLGSECENLPGYVVINCGVTPGGGIQNFGNGFLPAIHQGTVFRSGAQPIADVVPLEGDPARQRRKLDAIRRLDLADIARSGGDSALDAALSNYELAFRMQGAVPSLTDLGGETAATRQLYGIDEKATEPFGWGCLMARRLVERGVRFIMVTPPETGFNRWDQHKDLEPGLRANAAAMDRPAAALLTDLAARGLLDETIVLWGGEFGRTPSAQGRDGRDHNPYGFTMWMAGGGFQGGLSYGATDEYGYKAVENPVTMHDLHATLLHQLGFDHERLTFRHAGRDFRLTDVHGRVVRELIA